MVAETAADKQVDLALDKLVQARRLQHPQADFGIHIFTREGRAITLEMDAVHHSNASLGNQNPGYNGSYFFTVGYTWYKTRK